MHAMDVTDVFQDEVFLGALGLLPTHTVHNGVPEPLKLIFQSYFVNVIGDEMPDNMIRANVGYGHGWYHFRITAPQQRSAIAGPGRRHTSTALFVQYTGWGPTATRHEILHRDVNRARNLDEYKAALQYFDTLAPKTWIYSDVEGNIGYFTSAEKPLRADLAAGTVDGGIPPWFIRDGTGALNHEWLPVMNPQPAQVASIRNSAIQ